MKLWISVVLLILVLAVAGETTGLESDTVSEFGEGLVYWQGDVPEGLTCEVQKVQNGKWGETVHEIRLINASNADIPNQLRPIEAKWTSDAESIQAADTEHFFIDSSHVVIGKVGQMTMRGVAPLMSAGDVFVTVPSSDNNYKAAFLVTVSGSMKAGETLLLRLYTWETAGNRAEALNEAFRKRGGYRVDTSTYDMSQYKKPELAWSTDLLAAWLNWAWDKDVMDPVTGKYKLHQSIVDAKKRFGGYDLYILWPFWPRAGFDQRFQYDHFKQLPGGIEGMQKEVKKVKGEGVRFAVSYCVWSEWDRNKDEAFLQKSRDEFVDIAIGLNADVVLMDVMDKTPEDMLERSRSKGSEVVPFNEGDPGYYESQTNLIGRIHNGEEMRVFNLKRFLLPHHTMLRVCEPGNFGGYGPNGEVPARRMRQDLIISFLNGHGIEINTMVANSFPPSEADIAIFAPMLDILRTHRANFKSESWQPMVQTLNPKVLCNEWPSGNGRIFTLCGTDPAGHQGPLLELDDKPGVHYFDLWRKRPITPRSENGKVTLDYHIEGYQEGLGATLGKGDYSPGCIAEYPRLIDFSLEREMLKIALKDPKQAKTIELWKGDIRPDTKPVVLEAKATQEVDILKAFGGHFNDAIVIRVLDEKGQTLDMAVEPDASCRFLRTEKPERTKPHSNPTGMVRIPAGRLETIIPNAEWLLPHGWRGRIGPARRTTAINVFWMDALPVTNAQYLEFVKATGYKPEHKENYLRHWKSGKPRKGEEDFPVVWVDFYDAAAYAKWAGKRLPSFEEWQFAGGMADGRKYPWGDDLTTFNNEYRLSDDAPRVDLNEDSLYGDTEMRPSEAVGKHPELASPYGVQDMCGVVWQWTGALYDKGRHIVNFPMGGSYFQGAYGHWWLPGGARPLDEITELHLYGPAMNRFATVGFRCAAD